MEGVGRRCDKLKKQTDAVARKWQKQVDPWLKVNNMTEKQYLEEIDKNWKILQNGSHKFNGASKAHQRNSGSDDGHNSHSSSQEAESPDSQRANQSVEHQSNHNHSFDRKSSSPLQLDNPATRNQNSAEFNANLSIDPKEVIPIQNVQESPVKSDDRFCVPLKENMFKAVKLKEAILEVNLSKLLYICEDVLKLPLPQYPEFVKAYKTYWDAILKSPGEITRNSGDCTRSVNGEKDEDSIHMPNPLHNSHNMPSTSQQGAGESSRSCPESKHDNRRKHMKETQPVAKVKELKIEQRSFHDGKNLPTTSQLDAEESSRNCSGFRPDKRRKHIESTHSVINSKELKLQQQPTQNVKKLSSMSQLGGRESAKTCPATKLDKKRNHAESSLSVTKINVLKEEQQLSQGSKSKHMLRTDYVAKGKESKEVQQLTESRTLNFKESAHSTKVKEFKNEHQMSQDGKLKLDPKRVCAMALEARNCDKNHIKKKDSPDQSAMLAITSSKKERTSLYHGGRKAEISRLKDLCVQTLNKAIKQNSDPIKFINKNVDFEIIEPVLVLITPDKLQKVEDKLKYLKEYTDPIWQFCCKKQFKSQMHLKKKNENWRAFYQRCCFESEEKLRNLTASISASTSKAKPDRQIKFTTVDGPPTKRPRIDIAMIAKSHANNTAIKPLPNSCQPSNSRSDAPVPLKGLPNHIKSSHKTIKKDAPLMHKAKKTLGQLHRIHRN